MKMKMEADTQTGLKGNEIPIEAKNVKVADVSISLSSISYSTPILAFTL